MGLTEYHFEKRFGGSVFLCVGLVVRASGFEPSVFVVVGYHGSGD